MYVVVDVALGGVELARSINERASDNCTKRRVTRQRARYRSLAVRKPKELRTATESLSVANRTLVHVRVLFFFFFSSREESTLSTQAH